LARHDTTPFTEKGFYLGEFRGRTLAIVLPDGERDVRGDLLPVLKELEANETDVVLVATGDAELSGLVASQPIPARGEGLEGRVWRELRTAACAGVVTGSGGDHARQIGEIALRLGIGKLVWLDPAGGVRREGLRDSFVDLEQLEAWLRAGVPGEPPARRRLLQEIERVLRAGLPAVNVCTAQGLSDELFTYAGSGTLFTRERYVAVRKLGIDDYDAADDLVARGVSEGYLAPRDEGALDRIFSNGFGAFVEGRHLAGIGALLPYTRARAAEIASLYTLTRFLGEGVGGHLVAHLCQEARDRELGFVFACTHTERVAGFFERLGFDRVAQSDIPDEKWRHYEPERRPSAICLRRALAV
jgi:N-acetylglutamate synthase-like GNAT family acetyltransferase